MKPVPVVNEEMRAAAVLVTAAYEAAVYLDGPQPPGSEDPETLVAVLRLLANAVDRARTVGDPIPTEIAAVDEAFRLRDEDTLTSALFQMAGLVHAIEDREAREDAA